MSASRDEFPVVVKVAGKEVEMKAVGLTVELQRDDKTSTHTYRFGPADLEDAEKLFEIGKVITVSFKAE